MRIKLIGSILGLVIIGVTHGGEYKRYHVRSNAEETQPPPATTEASPVNVSTTLANYDGLNLIHNADQKTIGFVNVTENVGLSITGDYESTDKVLLDSKTGRAICFKHLDKVVLTQNEEFRGDVLKSLQLILENYVLKNEPPSGNSTEIKASSEDALSLWSEVYLHLGHPKEKGSTDYRSLKYLQVFAKGLKHLYTGPLKGLIVGKGPFPLKQNLNRFITISLGLNELFEAASGGLKNILSKGVSFEVNSLFNAKNGAEVLVYILRQTGTKFDISVLWGNVLNNPERLLDIIGKLGGGESKNGVDETFAIINHFWAAVGLKISITDFIQFLFESSSDDHWSQADDGDFKQILKDIKNVTDEQSKKYDNVIRLSGFVKFFTNLTTNELIDNNVNISELVEKWRKRDAIGGLKVITHITLKIFNPTHYGDLIFNSFTAFLNATSDKEAVQKILPGVSLEDFTGKEGSVLQSICKNNKIDEQLKKGGDPSKIFNGIPVFNEFSKVYRDSLGRDFDFSKLLNGGSFSAYLSRLGLIGRPIKLGVDAFSKLVEVPVDVLSHIFIDPIRNFLPVPGRPSPDSSNIPLIPNLPGLPSPNIPSVPDLPNLPFLPPRLIPSLTGGATQKPKADPHNIPLIPNLPGLPSPNIPSVPDLPNLPFLPPGLIPSLTGGATQKPKAEGESKEAVSIVTQTPKQPTEELSDSKTDPSSTEKESTPPSAETHLTASVSTSKTQEDPDATELVEVSRETTTKKCEDCDDISTKSSKDNSVQSSTAGIILYKHHHHKKHNDHHQVKNHHTEHKYRHHNHENKHHSRKHHQHEDKKNHERKNHSEKRLNNGESHQGKHHSRRHNHQIDENRHYRIHNYHIERRHQETQH